MDIRRPLSIAFDQDDVLAAWGARYNVGLDARGPEAAGIPRLKHGAAADDVTFDLHRGRTARERSIITEVMNEPGFYADLDPIPGAVEVLEELDALGHDLLIVTAPHLTNYSCPSDKVAWVARHLGEKWMDRIVISRDKTRVRADVLVDDRPRITGALPPTWRHLLFGIYPYNAHSSGVRLAEFTDAAAVLSKIEELA